MSTLLLEPLICVNLSTFSHIGRKSTGDFSFVFDSRFTSFRHLPELNSKKIGFITLRRRGRKLLENVDKLKQMYRISIPHAKRKFPNPLVHVFSISLTGYNGLLRQLIIRGNGHEKPVLLITNDFEPPVELLVDNYSRRWRVENVISEAVNFFNLNALSSHILVKVHFDVIMTMIAKTLYKMLPF